MIEAPLSSDSPEERAAKHLADAIVSYDPTLRDSGQVNICVLAGVQCYGQSPQDLDLVILINDRRPSPFMSTSGIALRNCCIVIELKSHDGNSVKFEGPHCYVQYSENWHNVSTQSRGQLFSLRNYLAENSRINPPFIVNLIWLRQLPSSILPTSKSNLLARDSTWQQFIDIVVDLQNEAVRPKEVRPLAHYFEWVNVLHKKISPGALDRKKLEVVSRSIAGTDKQYIDKLGSQLLIFRGRGGTGKTLRLLQLAKYIYQDLGLRVLLLTYNVALAADLKRLLTLMNISDGIAQPGIGVRSVHKLFRDWFVALGLLEDSDNDFLEKYDDLKCELFNSLTEGAIRKDDLDAAMRECGHDLAWEFLLIDECQDWPINERDILYQLYAYNSIVLADGVDQLVRSENPTDWRAPLKRSEAQIVSLRRSLRLKINLCDVVNHVAEQLEVSGWNLEPEPDIYGGQIIVLSGAPFTRTEHKEVMDQLISNGNSPIDMLYCVPPQLVHSDASGQRWSEFGASLNKWGYKTWDGVSNRIRSSYPTSLDQHRIVQYDSSRGLEGWTVVCLGLDLFYEYKKNQFVPNTREDMFIDEQAMAASYAAQWTMIPLTRAIDTLVVQFEDPDHLLAQIFYEITQSYPNVITWRS